MNWMPTLLQTRKQKASVGTRKHCGIYRVLGFRKIRWNIKNSERYSTALMKKSQTAKLIIPLGK